MNKTGVSGQVLTGFSFDPLPTRVLFGAGEIGRLKEEVRRIGFTRVVVLCDPQGAELAREVVAPLGNLVSEVYPHAVMHVPDQVASEALTRVRELKADGCIAIGGGTSIGLAKAIVRAGGPGYVAVPTTYAGSEMTPIWGTTSDSVKNTGRDPRVRPHLAIYDPNLTLSLPVAVSVASGVNAMAHAVEALYAPDRSPVISLMAEAGLRAIIQALPRIVDDPKDPNARAIALYGAWLSGSCLGATTMSLHHKLCHTLGGTFNLPHADTHAVVLPYALAYNAPGAADALRVIGDALGDPDPVEGLWAWLRSLNGPRSLRQLGLTEHDIDRAVELAGQNAYANPVPVTTGGLRDLLTAALDGEPPQPPFKERSAALSHERK